MTENRLKWFESRQESGRKLLKSPTLRAQISDFSSRPWPMAKFAPPPPYMGDPVAHGDPQTSPQHPNPHGLGAFLMKTIFPNLVASNLVVCNHCNVCALLRPLFCALLCSSNLRSCVYTLLRSFALFCAHLRVFLRLTAFRTSALTLQPLLFWISLLFSFSDFPCFFCPFSIVSKDFRGSAKIKTLVFFGVSLAFFSKKNNKGIAKGGVKNRDKGGCKRLFAFVHVCLRLLAFSPLRLLAFVSVCLRLFAFARICLRPPFVTSPLRDTDPEDPPVLKILRRANFGTGTKFATTIAKRYGECSEILVFLGEKDRKTVQILKNYGGSRILRPRAPYYF